MDQFHCSPGMSRMEVQQPSIGVAQRIILLGMVMPLTKQKIQQNIKAMIFTCKSEFAEAARLQARPLIPRSTAISQENLYGSQQRIIATRRRSS